MSVKASAHITISIERDIESYWRYYLLQSSTLAKPSKPTTNPPSSSWDDAEPSYESGSTNSLYFVDLTVFTDGTFSYSDVSLSSSYEAAKEAHNKAVAAGNTATEAKDTVDNMEIGGTNLLLNTNKGATGWGMNRYSGAYTITSETMLGVNGVVFDITEVSTSWSLIWYSSYNILFDKLQPDTEYTISCDIWTSVGYGVTKINIKLKDSTKPIATDCTVPAIPAETWTRVEGTFKTISDLSIITKQYLYWNVFNTIGQVKICNLKLEKGNKATDWTPAPEDVEEGIESAQTAADAAQNTADSATERVNAAELTIDSINACIASLVVGSNGESLMIQTEDGWRFNIGNMQDTLNTTSSNLNSLTNTVGSVEDTVLNLQDAVDDLGVLAEYVRITTYYNEETQNNEPCIELGESDSEFKVLITNTRILFMEGSNTPTYIKDNTLMTNNVEVKNELRQTYTNSYGEECGHWIWSVRQNGNLGLVWKEV